MPEEIESIALAMREHWELDLFPISNLQLTLEENGIVITGFDTVDRKIDAFSQQILIDDGNVFFIAVAQGEKPKGRIFFDMAHELGHILLHPWSESLDLISKEEFKSRENQATRFASAFLLPKESFLQEIQAYPTEENIMKKCVMNESAEIYISAVDIEAANLNEWQSLELHLLDQSAVVIPGEMTVMEVVQTAESLQGLASDLLAAIGNACEKCDGCNVELLCNLMKGKIRPEVSIPPEVLSEAGTDPDSKLACEFDPKSGTIHVVETDYRYDLTDISSTLLDTFREYGICLNDLEMKLKEESVVYGAEANKSFLD